MMNLRQRSVNVSRTELIAKLKDNLDIHRKEYQEALVEYHARLIEDLKLAQKKVSKVTKIEDLKNFRFNVAFPQNHEKDYVEVIEMLEMSVDDTINLDAESFRAYIKNEWAWKGTFETTKLQYALAGSSLTL